MSKKIIETRHVFALMDKVKADMTKIGYVMTIAMQIFLFFYYSLSIYMHRTSVIYIVIYATLLTISVSVFVEQIIYHHTYGKKKEDEIKSTHKRINRIFRYIGLANKITLLGVSLVPIIKGEASDFDKVATIALAILIILQFALIFIAYLMNRYMEWLKMAIDLDLKESRIYDIMEAKHMFSNKIHDFATNLKPEEETNEFEEHFRDELENVDQRQMEKKEKKKTKRDSQLKEDLQFIKNHFRERKMEKKTNDKKMEKAYLRCKSKAEGMLSDEKKLNEFLLEVEKSLKKNPPSEDMLYIDYLLSEMEEGKDSLSVDEKKSHLINLFYYLNPILDNDKSTKDNLTILEKSEEEYGPFDFDKEEK